MAQSTVLLSFTMCKRLLSVARERMLAKAKLRTPRTLTYSPPENCSSHEVSLLSKFGNSESRQKFGR
jgi:hypothetical protein